MTDSLSAAQARRVFLNAQSLAKRRPARAVGEKQFREYLDRQGVLQLDSVNVLARAHYLPVYSRYGPYDPAAFDRYLWSSGENFEHWGHEASMMPIRLLPALRHRMQDHAARWAQHVQETFEKQDPGLVASVEKIIAERGPVTAADLVHLDPDAGRKRGSWWDASITKQVLEYLFFTGRAATAARPNFQRLYDSPERVWGEHHHRPHLPPQEARQHLFDQALAANGIGTVDDIADHYRIKRVPLDVLADSAVERGVARWVKVEGWGEPALLAASAEDPGRAAGAALVSPFDPLCWFRDRLLRMFGMHYRIEIYTPAAKRQYGYYALPFLLGDQMVARVDLKADRKASALLVQSSWLEETVAPGGRRRPAAEVAAALATELRVMADWLRLDDVDVKPAGTLAADLLEAQSAVNAASSSGRHDMAVGS
jgi:uncharacterized protein YcaQ